MDFTQNTYLQNLLIAQQNLGVLLAELTAHPKPNYSLDGESYSWSEYVQMIRTQLIGLQRDIQDAGGPYEVNTLGGGH